MANPIDRLHESLRAGCTWLVRHIDTFGAVGGEPALASLYYKTPASLVLNGDLGGALRVLDWIGTHFIGAQGQLAIPAVQEARRKTNTYDRGWLTWGAALCGRYDLAYPLADDIIEYQDREGGGFWDCAAARRELAGAQNAMSAGMAGLALLATRHVAEAQAAARFLLRLLDLQPRPDEGFFLLVERGAHGSERVLESRTSSDYLDRHREKQRPARLGPVIVLLTRLYRLRNDPRYLEGARRYADLVLTGREGIDLCVESHKYLWSLLELDQTAPDPHYRAAASRLAEHLVACQQSTGQWLADAAGSRDAEQSLDLQWNTTCNALVGLAYYRHLSTSLAGN